MTEMETALKYAQEHRPRFQDELIEFLKIPSISTLSEHKKDMEDAAKWVSAQLEDFGFENVDIIPTAKHPVVYGEHLSAGAGAPTVLFYGHYDVQPVDPLDEWENDPFDPVVKGENLYARGASDMKGQVAAHLKAVESMIKTSGLPINLKYMIEGEEEIGSPNLEKFLSDNKDLLSCDFCLNGDSGILGPDIPALTYSLRGLAYFEIRLQGAKSDLHSGIFGGVIDNPANVLARLIAGMKDEKGRIQLPGFYDNVRPITDEDRAFTHSMPDEWWLEQTGARATFGEEGYTSSERAAARPTLDVNGCLSGFTGEGPKTVLPARAMAKVSTRLVPDQRPEEIEASMRAYLEERMPPTVTWELEMLSDCLPGMVERDSSLVIAAKNSLKAVWDVEPVFVRQGGSVPVVGSIQDVLGVDSLIMGFGLPDDNLHAPNEKFHLPNYFRGIETFIRFSYELTR